MKRIRKAALVCGALCVCLACAFASCGRESSASSPFRYAETGESATYTDYTYTHGYISEEISSEKGAVYYYAQIAVQSSVEGIVITADDFTAVADGEKYFGADFVDFLRTEEKTEEADGAYTETVTISLKEKLSEREADCSRFSSIVNVAFGFKNAPSSAAVYYLGTLLNEVESGGERITSEEYEVGENLYAGIILNDEGDTCVKTVETGRKVYKYTYVNETEVNASYTALAFKVTVRSENVTVKANKFVLLVGDKSYECKGFLFEEATKEQNGELYILTNTVILSDTYTVEPSEIGDLRLAFDYSFPVGEEYTLSYDGVSLSE